ncbi:hypothetical protein GF373_01415 [bacterium]|nr:hypothetical protein [bacterium]
MAISNDPVWVRFPRWLEMSGLPGLFAEQYGTEAWLLFRKLVEIDCDQNLTPHWFSFSLTELAEQTGVEIEQADTIMENLKQDRRIERRDDDYEIQEAKITTPVRVVRSEKEIRERLAGEQVKSSQHILRYHDNTEDYSKVETVVYLYQMLFGPRFSPKIAQDLEELANTYDMAIIQQVFGEAFNRNIKTFAWIKSHVGDFEQSK